VVAAVGEPVGERGREELGERAEERASLVITLAQARPERRARWIMLATSSSIF